MRKNPAIFLAVGDTVRNPGRSGIQSVVRSLAAALGARALAGGHPDDPAVHPVIWNNGRSCFQPLPPRLSLGLGAEPLREPPGTPWAALLSQPVTLPAWLTAGRKTHDLPLHWHPRLRRELRRGAWLLLPELAYRGRMKLFLDYARRHGLRVAVVFHDAIPITHPEFCPPDLPGYHAEYMRELSGADLILPNSEGSAEAWREFIAKEKLPAPAVRVCTLASEIPGAARVREIDAVDPATRALVSQTAAGSVREPMAAVATEEAGPPLRILTVSTLEPRKNHTALLEAFDLAVAQAPPGVRLRLDLVGAPYVDAWHIVESVHRSMNRHRGIVHWHEKVEHSFLRQLYAACDFTVYPSVVEGFGLPVIESLWFGRPCICANFGVMAENAAGGGCLTADVRNPKALAAAILSLAESADFRRKLALEAVSRPLKSWAEYAEEVLVAMREEANHRS